MLTASSPCTDLHYALRRLAYRAGIAKITAAAFELLSLALIAKILDVVGVARFSTAHHRQHPNLSSGACVGHHPDTTNEDYDDESSISETSEESGNEDSDESEDEDEDEDEDEEEWDEEVQQLGLRRREPTFVPPTSWPLLPEAGPI